MAKQLIKLEDLNPDLETAFKNDQLNQLLNNLPNEKWIKLNKFANNSKYLPIDKVEYLLTRIFQEWKVEVLDYKNIFNAVTCSIRLHYKHPITKEWYFHDGVGASDVQVKAGSSASELTNINKNAIGMALPIAKSYAIKDAAHHLGRLFGKDLNRPDSIEFTGSYQEDYRLEALEALFDEKINLITDELKTSITRIIQEKEQTSYRKAISVLKTY